MTAFKGYVLVMKRNAGLLIMYFSIFLLVTILIQSSAQKLNEELSFQQAKLPIAVIDEDQSVLSSALVNYMEENQNIITREYDERKLVEEMYYDNISYVLIIPEGFGEDVKNGTAMVSSARPNNSTSGIYEDIKVNGFITTLSTYMAAGYTESLAAERTLFQFKKTPQVEIIQNASVANIVPSHAYYFQYVPYMFICVLSYGIGSVLTVFQKKDLKQRISCSAVSSVRRNMQAFSVFLILTIAIYIMSFIVAAFMYGGDLFGSVNLKYYAINSFLSALTALSLSFVIGSIAKGHNAVNGLVNVFSLGFCFLGGVFVPLYMLGEGVKKVSVFLPTYWYEMGNNIISKFNSIPADSLQLLYKYFGIQLLMSAVMIAVAFSIRKLVNQD